MPKFLIKRIAFSHWLSLRKKCPYSELFWSAFFPHFPAFGLNTGRYSVSLRIQSECGKVRKNTDQNNSEYGHFLRSVSSQKVLSQMFGRVLNVPPGNVNHAITIHGIVICRANQLTGFYMMRKLVIKRLSKT